MRLQEELSTRVEIVQVPVAKIVLSGQCDGNGRIAGAQGHCGDQNATATVPVPRFAGHRDKVAVVKLSCIPVSGAVLGGQDCFVVCETFVNPLLASMKVNGLKFPANVVGEEAQEPTVLLVRVGEGGVVSHGEVGRKCISLKVKRDKQLSIVGGKNNVPAFTCRVCKHQADQRVVSWWTTCLGSL